MAWNTMYGNTPVLWTKFFTAFPDIRTRPGPHNRISLFQYFRKHFKSLSSFSFHDDQNCVSTISNVIWHPAFIWNVFTRSLNCTFSSGTLHCMVPFWYRKGTAPLALIQLLSFSYKEIVAFPVAEQQLISVYKDCERSHSDMFIFIFSHSPHYSKRLFYDNYLIIEESTLIAIAICVLFLGIGGVSVLCLSQYLLNKIIRRHHMAGILFSGILYGHLSKIAADGDGWSVTAIKYHFILDFSVEAVRLAPFIHVQRSTYSTVSVILEITSGIFGLSFISIPCRTPVWLICILPLRPGHSKCAFCHKFVRLYMLFCIEI